MNLVCLSGVVGSGAGDVAGGADRSAGLQSGGRVDRAHAADRSQVRREARLRQRVDVLNAWEALEIVIG